MSVSAAAAAPASAASLRQPHRVRSRRVAKGALGLAAAALVVVPFATGFFRVHPQGPPSSLAEADGLTLVMPFGTDRLYLCPTSSSRPLASRVARAAGYEGKPGGKPDLGDGTVLDEEPGIKLKKGEETTAMQYDRVEKISQWLGTLKGKFVPYGPKPWDKPRFTKVCIQVRLKPAQAGNTKIINQCIEELRRISGMHPRIVKARKNVAAFGWRIGMPCGVAVTMYGDLMRDFLKRLNTIILPRVRDFEGLYPSSVTNFGNFWMGVDSQEPFKELDELVDTREIVHGFDVGIHTNCLTQPDGLQLMKDFGFPFGDGRPRKGIKIKRTFVKMRTENDRRR